MATSDYFTHMLSAYIECALWTARDDDGDPLDGLYDSSDLAPETLKEMTDDCQDFLQANEDDLRDLDPGMAGHDFWLTRNGHGAGLWDRGLGALGERLTTAATVYGGQDLYAGDDGLLYLR